VEYVHEPKLAIHEVRSGSIRSDPPTSVRKPMRFESLLCLPVWSFNGPSRQDGVCVGSLCEPLLACHSIRFSRFKLQRIPCISCGFARCVPPELRSAARRYITHSHRRCQQVLGTFSRSWCGRGSSARSRRRRTPPDRFGGRSQGSMSAAFPRHTYSYVIVSERLSVFNTRSGLLWVPAVRQRRLSPTRPLRKSIPEAT
jgi:hypothetical protein